MARRKVIHVSTTAGTEPTWNAKTIPTQGDLAKALNWYNSNKDEKDAAKYLSVPVVVAREFTTAAWISRMLTRGYLLPENSDKTYKESLRRMEHIMQQRKGETGRDPEDYLSIQDRIRMRTDEIIGEMEGLVDQYGIKGNAKDMNAYQWMVDNDVKSIHCNAIVEHFTKCASEGYIAATGKEKDLSEGYAAYGKKGLMNLLQCYANIIKDAERLSHNASKQRKPRKKKPPSFEKMVSKINYKERDDSLKLASVDPVKIVGAQQLWIYNTKTRKLGIYNALDAAGLMVKGSTIKNFGKDSSMSKTLRKPEDVLPTVVNGGKIALRKVMENVKAKPSKLTGRINKDTLLLRIT